MIDTSSVSFYHVRMGYGVGSGTLGVIIYLDGGGDIERVMDEKLRLKRLGELATVLLLKIDSGE